jgi:hypothetical protein
LFREFDVPRRKAILVLGEGIVTIGNGFLSHGFESQAELWDMVLFGCG